MYHQRTTSYSLEGEILINIRTQHIKEIVKQFINTNIVSTEYLDNLIKLDNIKNGNTTTPDNQQVNNNEKLIEILEKILQKECKHNTAILIHQLTTHT